MQTETISPYLTFDGNCREAMSFYKDCLGGDLTLQTIGGSPMAAKMPKYIRDYILHATLTKGALVIMATDCVPGTGLIKGNSVSLALNCCSEKEIRDYYERLSAGGQVIQPLATTFWQALFGALTDKFGQHWLLNYDKGGE